MDQPHPFIVLNDNLPVVHLNHSSTTRPHPNIRFLPARSRSTAELVIFQSYVTYDVDIWYDDESGGELSYQGFLTPGETSSVTAYDGNIFLFTPKENSNKILKKYRISPNQVSRHVLISIHLLRLGITFMIVPTPKRLH